MLTLKIFAKSKEYEDVVVMNPMVIKAAAERDIAERKEMVLKEPRADEIKLEALV